jgi:hypothetical protein
MVFLIKPSKYSGLQLFINNKEKTSKLFNVILKRIGHTLIVNGINIEASSENCKKIEFYIDNQLIKIQESNLSLFSCYIDKLDGFHNLMIKGYDCFGNFVCENIKCLFKNIKR